MTMNRIGPLQRAQLLVNHFVYLNIISAISDVLAVYLDLLSHYDPLMSQSRFIANTN